MHPHRLLVSLPSRLCSLLAVAMLGLAAGASAFAQDRSTYAAGSRPQVLINWRSFEANGFPASWKDPFTSVVINAYTRLNQVLAVDVRPQFAGYTDRTDSAAGEIVISANEKHACSDNRLASTFGSYPDRLIIIVHAKNACDLTPWNFTLWATRLGELGLHGVLMHEFQHALGLDHGAPTKSIMGGYMWVTDYGPWSGDQTDMRAQYVLRTADRLRQLATYNAGASWSTLGNTLTSLNSPLARTTNKVAVAGQPHNASYVVGWSTPGNQLTWLRGDGVVFDLASWQIYGGGPTTRYGSAMKSDGAGALMWAVVDAASDQNLIKVLRSTDNAATWSYTNFPVARTAGTPGIATGVLGGRRAWIAMWANYDEGSQTESGLVWASASFDNGTSWSVPHRVDGFYKLHDGVSVEIEPGGQCRFSFVWAGEKGGYEYGRNKLRTLGCAVSPAGIVSTGFVCIQPEHSRTAPDLAWHRDSRQFTLALREPDYATSQNAARLSASGCPGGALHIPASTSHVAPALAANPAWSTSTGSEIVMWSARE